MVNSKDPVTPVQLSATGANEMVGDDVGLAVSAATGADEMVGDVVGLDECEKDGCIVSGAVGLQASGTSNNSSSEYPRSVANCHAVA